MFYSERQRIKNIIDRENQGNNLWTKDIPDAVRVKIRRYADATHSDVNDGRHHQNRVNVFEIAQKLLIVDQGKDYLTNSQSYPAHDMKGFISHCPDNEFPDVLEALYDAIDRTDRIIRRESTASKFEAAVNDTLESYRVSYTLENGKVIPFESREAHVEIIQPTIKLIAKKGWEKIETPYIKAIQEISDGNTDDAITDVTTALQEALRLMGCNGKDLKSLYISAKNTIFKGADSKYLSGVEKLMEWISATRANKGDGHKTVSPSKNEAWFVVHVVGVLILYLSNLKKS